ncbi:MAG: DUF222 domain-containing protein [Acidobacteria bacterium]|nr:DUF222 domain-containing protein [Acidobacteriota bacterium]
MHLVEQPISSPVTGASADASVTGLATERLEAELIGIVGSRAVQLHRLLHLIAEYDRRGVWVTWGVASCAHWLAETAGIEVCTAREQVRVAHALVRLPLIDAAMSDGLLSYSKVRAITRVATPDDQIELIEMGQRHAAGELGRALAARDRDRLEDR